MAMSTDQEIDRMATLHFIALVDSLVCETGHATEALLQGVDLKVEELHQGLKLITSAQEFSILRNALRLTGDRHLGLVLGSRCKLASYGIFGFTLLSSSNLRAALALLFEYPLPLGTGYVLKLTEVNGVATLHISDTFEIEAELRLLAVEFCSMALQRLISDLLWKDLPLLAVNIRGATSADCTAYQAHFKCPVSIGPGSSCALMFDARWLDLPLPWAHPAAHGEMQKQCSELKSNLEVPRNFLSNVRSAICAQFDKSPTLTNVADSVDCSSKTLQRHLRAAGTSFNEVLGELRYERAQKLLLQQVPVARVAEQLGFSESAAFRRAFQRWSGCTPSQYRSRIRH
ncbi:AraC family transcriptional regulator [Pseudomonas sp. TH31]|uniref:AraC family transcriptional regulator n=1 Tax=Pseudomonas sp. TH31 TaxID=2796396 RepID=UPI001911C532|nr:AraC family transcriptional regulator [Pseudomonas sp. TH31]MBK5413267.1 AraC family transcriptional regulator [Pseudomonas sp. TH31]